VSSHTSTTAPAVSHTCSPPPPLARSSSHRHNATRGALAERPSALKARIKPLRHMLGQPGSS
jgi:hypothetical protein